MDIVTADFTISSCENNYNIDINQTNSQPSISTIFLKEKDSQYNNDINVNNKSLNSLAYSKENFFLIDSEKEIKNIENNKYEYRQFIIYNLNRFINIFNSLEPDIKRVLFAEDFTYRILDILLKSPYIEEKIETSLLLANLTFYSNDIIESIKDDSIIDALFEILILNINMIDLMNNILIIIGNIITINSDFVFKKTKFFDFYIKLLNESKSRFHSTLYVFNGIIMEFLDVHLVEENHIVKNLLLLLIMISKKLKKIFIKC